MKGDNVYSKVQQLREAGFTQLAVADTLKINRKTVKRYWDVPIEEYETKHQKTVRIRVLDTHRDKIISWLRQYPDSHTEPLSQQNRLRVQIINKQEIIFPSTKKQRTIYEAFEVPLPD